MKAPKYIVTDQKLKVLEPLSANRYEFDDESAARQFWNEKGGSLFENVNGNYLKIK